MNHHSSAQQRGNPRSILSVLAVAVLFVLLALFWQANDAASGVVRAEEQHVSQEIIASIDADACVTNDPDLPSGACNSAQVVNVGWFLCVELCQGGAYRGLMRAELPALPPNATVVEAYFAVYTDANPSSQAMSVSLYRITSDWDEDAVDWGSQPSHASVGNLGGVIQPGGGWYGLDATAILQEWYNDFPNNGVMLISDGENTSASFFSFFSREAPNHVPTLHVIYELAAPTATSTATPTATPTPTVTATPTNTPTPTDLPQLPHMDIGDVRVWADAFSTANGVTTASGNVLLGPKTLGDLGKYFTSSQPVSWGSGGPLNMNGILGLVRGGRALGQGGFTVDPASGAVTWAPGAQMLYNKLGSSNLSIMPVLTINVVQGQVNGSAQLNLVLPESNTIAANIQFTIGFDGAVTGSGVVPVQLKLAGGTLTAQVGVNSDGLVAAQAQYTLPEIGTLQINDLVIDGKGDTGLRFGAAADFKLPDLNIGNGFFRFTEVRGKLSLNTAAIPTAYQIGVVGKLNLEKLPENGALQVNTLDLKIVSGALAGKLSNFHIQVAGRTFDLDGVSFGPQAVQAAATDVFSYTLFAEGASFSPPQSWAPQGVEPPKISLKAVTLQTEAPYIMIGSGGATFNTSQAFYLGGDPTAKASVRFDQIQGEFKYVAAGNEWQVAINARISFLFGNESATVSGLLTIRQGGISGQLAAVNFTVAGLSLTVSTLDYNDDAFSAASAELTLPASWGGEKLLVNGLRIDKNGVQLGGAGGAFNIPDRDLGDVLRLSGMTASVSIDAQRRYSIKITATVTVRKVEKTNGGNSVSVGATLEIKNGRVSGALDSFAFRLAGIEFAVAQPRFLDNHVNAQVVALTLPIGMQAAAVNDVGIKLFGLEIGGPKGFSVQGGGFKLPDFKIGQVGVRNAQAEFVRLPDGSYSIKSSADIAFAAITVGGSFHIVYDPPTSSLGLRKVSVLFQGSIPYPAIPIGNTGFFITGISGEFDLTSGTLQVEFGVHGAYAYEIAGIALFSADAKTIITFAPWTITMTGEGKFLGIPVSNDTTRINATSFMTDGTVENQIWRGIVTLAFGKDADNEFTIYGRAELEVGLRAKSIGCIVFVCIPPFDFTVARRGYDAGKFNRSGAKVWGARTYAELFGFQVFIFARFAPGIGVDAGFNLNAYQPVLPALSAAETSDLLTHYADIDAPAMRVTIGEAITLTNRAAPLALQVTRPDGIAVTPVIAYESPDHSLRTYAFDLADPAKAVGRWAIRTQPGNALMVWGAEPPPLITSFTVSTGGVQLASSKEAAAARLEIASGAVFQIAWSVSSDAPGLTVELFAADSRGTRYPIASQSTQTGSQLSDNMQWTPGLPSGVYTLTLQADDSTMLFASSRKQPITIVDAKPPAAPAQVQAQARLDGSVFLTWDDSTAEADIAEYWVSIDGGASLVNFGQTDRFTLYGLSAGGVYQIAIEAVDSSGNHSAPATVSATLPTVAVTANSPRRDATAEQVSEIWATFNQPITPLMFTITDATGQAIVGSSTPIAVETSVEETTVIGARFAPNAGSLPAGHYTATLSVLEVGAGAVVTHSWAFDVVASASLLYLPIVAR